MTDIVATLTWILALILDTHLPLFLAPLLTFTFGGFAIALAYGYTSSRSKDRKSEATWIKIRGILFSLFGFVSLFILYVIPLSVTIEPYMLVLTAAIVAFKDSISNVEGTNLIWAIFFEGLSVEALRRGTGVARKKLPRTVGKFLTRMFVALLVTAVTLSVLVAAWKAAQAAFPNLHLP